MSGSGTPAAAGTGRQGLPSGRQGLPWLMDDGGRAAAGFKGHDAGDCGTRAVALATGRPYREIYDELQAAQARWIAAGRTKEARRRQRLTPGANSVRNGVQGPVMRAYLASLGWRWHPTMQIGSGTTVHLAPGELPTVTHPRLIVQVSKHYTAVLAGVVHDNHDPSRDGERCVYGYYTPPQT